MRIQGRGYAFIVAVVASFILKQPELLVTGQATVPAMFVLGDSLVDVGNNNFLASVARANYLPYGIDLNFRPTGRFSNGMNFGDRFSLSQQVVNLEGTLSQLRTMMSPQNFTDYLKKSLVVLVFGSNDYLNNYLMPNLYSSSFRYKPPEFANLLINQYARQLLTLYSLGLRKVFIAGVGPLGCIPNQRATAPPGRCVDSVNQILGTFNQGLRSLVDQLNQRSPGAIYVYGNTYRAVGDILNNPATYGINLLLDYIADDKRSFYEYQKRLMYCTGFSIADRACCGTGRNQGQITCLPLQNPCPNRSQYVFWDAFHPTQTANSILVRRAFYGPPTDAYPVNVQQMTLLP
ncbi:hypothetical protein YC2023_080086 [Brassica napus]